MAEQMELIIAGPGQHVLAAMVRQDMAGGDPKIETLVGDALPLRDGSSGTVLVNVPPEHLKVVKADLREDVMLTPRQFALVSGFPQEGATPAPVPVQLSGTTITVTLPSAAVTATAVWIYVEGAAQPIVHQSMVAQGTSSIAEPLQIPTGSYTALVLATGFRAAITTVTVP